MKRPLVTVLSALAVAGLLACGASAAQAADDDTVVYTNTYVETQDSVSAYFTKVDPATLNETVLSSYPWLSNDDGVWLTGMEVYGGTGYAIRGLDGGEKDIFTWNITTGEQSVPVELNYTDAGFFGEEVSFIETWSLDATTDGRILAIGFFDPDAGGGDNTRHAVIEVDPATGVITPLVDLTAALNTDTFWFQGIATDPTTSTTYLLGYHYESGEANEYPAVAVPVNLGANTIGSPITISSYPSSTIDDINEGDFDEAGVLYVLSDDGVLGRFSSPLVAGSTFNNLGSPAQVNSDVFAVTGAAAPPPVIVDPGDGPTLAATGASVTPLALGGLSALVCGGLVIAWVTRSRRRV